MQVRLLLGPAGSGKTFRCLNEARQALCASPEGLPLLVIAPRQGTYQLEQQLLSTESLAGYTRLSIASFESVARMVFSGLGRTCPKTLTEEGRLMVLRALLAGGRRDLKLFRASARLTGFAEQLSQVLGEAQRAQLTPAALRQLAGQVSPGGDLSYKLEDLATLFEQYLDWLQSHGLPDPDVVLKSAIELLREAGPLAFRLGALWVDGFAEFSELELDLLSALIPGCGCATVTFCLDAAPAQKISWLSHWSTVAGTFERCRKQLAGLDGVELSIERLPRLGKDNRFSKNPVLRHLEMFWTSPQPFQDSSPAVSARAPDSIADGLQLPLLFSHGSEPGTSEQPTGGSELEQVLRVVTCAGREAEVILAAREIVGFVREGARYRDVSVLLRKLEPYQQTIQRVFSRYQIPFFLDRRESIAHHPLAELTRSAVRLAAFGWQQQDWFAALKSGLVPARDEDIDLLENESLARGWRGRAWREPIHLLDDPKTDQEREHLKKLEAHLEQIRRKILPPFESFMQELSAARNRPAGPQLAVILRHLWSALQVEHQLENWAAAESEPASGAGISVHETVWRQINSWLENAELAFPAESLSLREWVPILEAGLANLTVGIIPPALDQVLVGALDRSRTPEVKLALVLGLNEGVFPASPELGSLLTETDRLELERQNVFLGSSARRQLAREKYLAYIACTRARKKLILTCASLDANGAPMNPSPLLSHIARLFPNLRPEVARPVSDWKETEHVTELAGTILSIGGCGITKARGDETSIGCSTPDIPHSALLSIPGLAAMLTSLRQFRNPQTATLTPELAARLYGPVLRTSVSRMEQFAACPFKFFVHSGLRAEERKLFELDVKEQGTFQHDVLALFHQELRAEGRRWRDLTGAEARERVGKIARNLADSFREGLFGSSDETRFTARVLTESLQDFVETLVGWMREQYQFDPFAVELPFGGEGGLPAWSMDLPEGNHLELHGRIDRVDIYRAPDSDRALCVVIDYKSSEKKLDPVLIANGLQLQLLAYLNVIGQWPNPRATFGADILEPAGVFYVNLRGKYPHEANRNDALADPERDRKLAYRHAGRFDLRALPQLDRRLNVKEGDQFSYRLTNDGQVNKSCKEALATDEFEPLLSQVEKNLKAMGQQIYAGRAEVEPYRKGVVTACAQCTYQAVCRVDPWTHPFRVLRRGAKEPLLPEGGQE